MQAQIEAELHRHWDRLHQGLNYYKPPWYATVVWNILSSLYLFLKMVTMILFLEVHHLLQRSKKTKTLHNH